MTIRTIYNSWGVSLVSDHLIFQSELKFSKGQYSQDDGGSFESNDQPYMIAGNLAKSVICGVGDIVTDILPCENNNSNRNPFKKDATEDRDDSAESGGGGNPLK